MNNEHKISTLHDILDLASHENVDDFIVDLGAFIKAYGDGINILRMANPEICEGKKNHEIMEATMTWIDDKKHDLKSVKINFSESKS